MSVLELPPEFCESYYLEQYNHAIASPTTPSPILVVAPPPAVSVAVHNPQQAGTSKKDTYKAKIKAMKGIGIAESVSVPTAFPLHEHYLRWGRRDGQIASPAARRAHFLKLVRDHLKKHPQWTALEIGPYFNPILKGDNVRYMDIMDADSLRRRAVSMGLDPTNVPDTIHYIGTDLMMIPDQSIDFVISSHNIEHQPDLVSHLQNVQRILKPETGLFCVICPDWRYCFDRSVGESTIGDVLEAYYDPRRKNRHSLASIIEQRVTTTHNDAVRHWTEGHDPSYEKAAKLEVPGVAERIKAAIDEHHAATDYIDLHGFQYTPHTFKSFVHVLHEMGLISLRPHRVYDTPHGSHEFVAVLTV